jgi:tRNA(Ile)-lysidine synthetase-like protein
MSMELEAKILSAVAAALKEQLPPGGRLFVGVSGGLDSSVLLATLFRLVSRGVLAAPVIVLHVNHDLRGVESEADGAFVAEQSRGYGFEFRLHKILWRKGEKRSQSHCREKRMAWMMEQLGKKDRLLLAHHGNDQAETVLSRLLRGTGPKGLVGIRSVNGKILRPLLPFSRAELEVVAKEWGIQWREDSSNTKTIYERNWIRLELLPLLESKRPGVVKRLNALAKDVEGLLSSVRSDGKEIEEAPSLTGSTARLIRVFPDAANDDGFGYRFFGLDRQHSARLSLVIKKGRGQLQAAHGKRFFYSRGFLLVARGPLRTHSSAQEHSSVLGKWSSSSGDGRPQRGFRNHFPKSAVRQSSLSIFPDFLRNSVLLEKSVEGSAVPIVSTEEFLPSAWYLWLTKQLGLKERVQRR